MSMFAPLQNGRPTVPKIGLHSFKAGKLTRVEGTKRVKPDSRKGLIYLQEVDDLLHFYWKDRATGAIEDDLIIFPEEAELIKVQQSPSGRVFALKFSSSSQIMFYWMQEKESSNDEADVQRVNDLIADPKAVAPQGNDRGAPALEGLASLAGLSSQASGDAFGGLDLSAAAQSMGLSQDQLMQILGSEDLSQLMTSASGQALFGGATDNTADVDMMEEAVDAAGGGDTTEQLSRDIPEPINPSGEAAPSAGQEAAISNIRETPQDVSSSLRDILSRIQVPQQATENESLDLKDVLKPDLVLPLLANQDVRKALFPHLPANLVSDPPTESEVRDIVTSVQWRQALSGLSYALNNGGESVIRSLGLDATNLQGGTGVEAFLRAVKRQLDREDNEHNDDAMEE